MKYSFYKRIKRVWSRYTFILFFSKSFKKFGKKVFIESPDIIEGEKYISLGDNVSIGSMCWLLAYKQSKLDPVLNIAQGSTIGRFCHIVSLRKVSIKENVLIADKVYISDNIHSYENIHEPILSQAIKHKSEVIIGEHSWIGENVAILGAKIGRHCVIGSNSVVIKDVEDYCVAVGNPAKVIKKYDFKDNEWKKI
jgi:acetyltransferase-like isoleucine patch superfamily enzyme